MILRCEVCETDIGAFDPGALALPLTGAVFGPLSSVFPAPFQPEATWEYLLCPTCGRRAMGWDLDSAAMVRPDRLMTPEGYFVVGQGLEQTGPAPYVHDSSDIAEEWEALLRERQMVNRPTEAKRPVEQSRKGKRR